MLCFKNHKHSTSLAHVKPSLKQNYITNTDKALPQRKNFATSANWWLHELTQKTCPQSKKLVQKLGANTAAC